MTDHIPTEEMVEAAARRMWRDENGFIRSHDSVRTRESDEAEMDRTGFGDWDSPSRISSVVKKAYRKRARAALSAALPFLRPEPSEDEMYDHVMQALDTESHTDVCGCTRWPDSCVTYGDDRPWTHSEYRVVQAVLALFKGDGR